MIDHKLKIDLHRIVGDAGLITDPDLIAPRLVEPRGKYHGATNLMLRPATTAEVAACVAACHKAHQPIVPQGGNTGNVGGQTPPDDGSAIILSLDRMTGLLGIDKDNQSISMAAGMTLATAQSHAADAGMYLPLSMASEGSCTIGGNIATNAGGTAVLRYGNTRAQVLGLEAVMADGQTINLMNGLRKDNTGYDLKQLLIGSEGTLGIVTAARLALVPAPQQRATAMVALDTPEQALALLTHMQTQTGNGLTAFEFMPQVGLQFLATHRPDLPQPFAPLPAWAVLLEATAGQGSDLAPRLEAALTGALDAAIAADVVIAQSGQQADIFWALRESLPAAQKPEGGSIKHDIAVPVSAVPAFLNEAEQLVTTLCPGVRIVAFGHMGDGNIHYNLTQPAGADTDAYLARWDEVQTAVHDLVVHYGGSISAEHGIGQMKVAHLERYKDPVALAAMRAIKRTLDPHNILNPGKVLA